MKNTESGFVDDVDARIAVSTAKLSLIQNAVPVRLHCSILFGGIFSFSVIVRLLSDLFGGMIGGWLFYYILFHKTDITFLSVMFILSGFLTGLYLHIRYLMRR